MQIIIHHTEATIFMSILAGSCIYCYLLIDCYYSPCGVVLCYLLLFLALLELCRGEMNVNLKNLTGTPAADDKGLLEGRYVE